MALAASEIPKRTAGIFDGALRVFGREKPAPDAFKKLGAVTIELLPMETRSWIVQLRLNLPDIERLGLVVEHNRRNKRAHPHLAR